jgi:hypothetical protein
MDDLLFLPCTIHSHVRFASGAVVSWRVHQSSYGFTSRPEQIAQSSRQFVDCLLHDLLTVEALAALPRALRKEFINGVRLMTARQFLTRHRFLRAPFPGGMPVRTRPV